MRISDWSSDVCSSDLFSLPTPVLVIDSENRVRLANAAAETLFNRSQSSLSQVTLAQLIPEAEAMLARAPASKPEDAGVAVYGLEIEPVAGSRHRTDLILSPLVESPGRRVVGMHRRGRHPLTHSKGVGPGDGLAATGPAPTQRTWARA